MGRNKQSVVYLDTHIVVWLYAELIEKLTPAAEKVIEDDDIVISQFVRLEMRYLYKIDRIRTRPYPITKSLFKSLGLKISNRPLETIMEEAPRISWTRDVFDRLLVAEAESAGCGFVSADKTIRSHYKRTIW